MIYLVVLDLLKIVVWGHFKRLFLSSLSYPIYSSINFSIRRCTSNGAYNFPDIESQNHGASELFVQILCRWCFSNMFTCQHFTCFSQTACDSHSMLTTLIRFQLPTQGQHLTSRPESIDGHRLWYPLPACPSWLPNPTCILMTSRAHLLPPCLSHSTPVL